MSQYARPLRMTDICTYWKEYLADKNDPYSLTWTSGVVLSCNWMNDSKMQRDDSGAEFMPQEQFRLTGIVNIEKGDRIIRGDYGGLSEPVDAAQTVRKVKSKTKLRGQPSTTIYTG